MIYLVLGLAALAAFLLLGNWLSRVPAAQIARSARYGGVAVLVGLAALLILTGRFHLVSQVMALAGHALRHRRAQARPKDFDDVEHQGRGGGPRIATRYLDMALDEGTGAIEGRFTAGPLAGRSLDGLSQAELVAARAGIADDAESLRLLDAYLDRTFAGWREHHDEGSGARRPGPADPGGMGEDEAYQILGLEPGADAAAIRAAHRRLMGTIHPDKGGSTYLAAKVNLATEVLLKLHG